MLRIRVRGWVPYLLTCGSGSCYFRQWPLRWQLKIIFFCLLLFEATFTSFFKIKSHKRVTKQQQSRFFLLFLLGDRRIRIQEIQKNTDADMQHWLKQLLIYKSIGNEYRKCKNLNVRFTPSSKNSAGGGKAAPLIPFTVTPPRPSGPTQVVQFF